MHREHLRGATTYALAALAQNRKLAELWVSVARVVRHGEAPGWQAVVAALTPHNVLVKVVRFLWPRFRVRPGLVEPQMDGLIQLHNGRWIQLRQFW